MKEKRSIALSPPSALLLALCLRGIGVVAVCILFYIQRGTEPFFFRRAVEMLQVVWLSLTLAVGGTLAFDADYKKRVDRREP